jgi:two-component system, OmpR family, response regulator
MRILVIDDDIDTQTFLKNRLEEKCFAVDTASDGERALYIARINEYDIILLDYMLPYKNGYELCATLRREGNHTPIIMISATIDVPHKISGFRSGIDDYVTKPFYFEELLARIQAILRRPKAQQSTTLKIGELILDTATQKVSVGKQEVYLTRKEFSLLEYLLQHAGTVVSRGTIMEHVWDSNLDPFSNTIETHILNLRKKINSGSKQKFIHSVPGRGYKIDLLR